MAFTVPTRKKIRWNTRSIQEGLTNARKHSRASRVDLSLDYDDPQRVRLVIKDNGVGAESVDSGGFGLLGVRERVQLLGGAVQIETGPGEGFSLIYINSKFYHLCYQVYYC